MMKLASYLVRGAPSYGVVIDGGLIDLRSRVGEKLPTLKTLLNAGQLGRARAYAESEKPDYRLDEVTFLPVIPDTEKIFCVGLNYHSHRQAKISLARVASVLGWSPRRKFRIPVGCPSL